MDRDWLEAQLAKGRSIESIAKEVGKHPSTVGHWLTKYGLASLHAARHAAKGPLDRELVAALVEEGLTIQQMAERLEVGATTVRYWLRRYGLTTARARGSVRPSHGPDAVIRECRRHGYTTWLRSGAGDRYRCRQCRIEAVTARRRRIKRQLIEEAGGRCILCGTTASRARCSSTTSTRPRSRLRSPCRELPARWRKQEPRQQNACSCARTVTPK